MEPVVDIDTKQPDFLVRTLILFPHPSTSLWRAIEAREVWSEFLNRRLGTPILDLGCGDGRFSRAVFDHATIDVGLDISITSVSSAKESSNHTHLVTGDGSRLPFRDRTFETVFSNSVLEHIPNVAKVLLEVRRILRPGGVIVFTVPSPEFSKFLFLPSIFHGIPRLRAFGTWYAKKRNALLSHNNIYQLAVWKSRLETAGLPMVQGHFCLPKAAIQVWDVMALFIYFFRTPLQVSPRLIDSVLKGSEKLRLSVLNLILRRFYLLSNSTGGDMIIVAGTPGSRMDTYVAKT